MLVQCGVQPQEVFLQLSQELLPLAHGCLVADVVDRPGVAVHRHEVDAVAVRQEPQRYREVLGFRLPGERAVCLRAALCACGDGLGFRRNGRGRVHKSRLSPGLVASHDLYLRTARQSDANNDVVVT